MLLSGTGIEKGFGDKPVLEAVDFTVEEGDRIGLIGVNGAGKSTLLAVMTGKLAPDAGEIAKSADCSVGFLEQDSGLESERTVREEMESVFAALMETEKALRRTEREMAALAHDAPEHRALAAEYDRLTAAFEAGDGYQIRVKIDTVLGGMGFSEEVRERKVASFSGGEKTRLAMAKLLLEQPRLLILDEPTNHLDFQTVMWLEDYLSAYKGALLLVSHDRYFLDRLTDRTWEIERHRLSRYPGNYSRYKVLKAERTEAARRAYEKQQAQIASMLDYAERNIARASTSNSAKSRLHRLANLERVEKPFSEQKTPSFRFEADGAPAKELLTVRGLSLAVGEGERRRVLAEDLSFSVLRGEKVAVIGVNGAGKTTLLKTLLGALPQEGTVAWGRGAARSWYDQESEQLDPENTALEELWRRFPQKPEQEIRSLLGRVLITGDNCYKKVGVLSGGERARLGFAVLMAERRNVLVLDEPTNHLDLASREELERALRDYGGTLLFVSHDRYFLNAIPTKILELDERGLTAYPGNFDEYRAAKEKEKNAEAPQTQPRRQSEGSESFYRSKRQRSEDARRKRRLAELEALVPELERKQAETEARLADPAVAADYLRVQELCAELETLKAEREAAEEEWLSLSEDE